MTRAAVLTQYPHRPPEVGVPGENPNLTERGLILTDFVDRVGDPIAIVAPDGSSHRAEVVMADALRALFQTLVGGQPSAEPIGVTYPAHWRPAAIEALRGALAAVPEFRSPTPALLVSDATAALTALQHEPGVPARGVIAVCDFGASGTSITLADAAQGFAPIGPTVRHDDLSGDLIDQALLTRVMSDLSAAGSVDLSGTSSIGSLTRLRAQCRGAKERLSTASVTSLAADLPGSGGEVRITRNELDDAIRAPLDGFVAELQETLRRSGIRSTDLVAVASVGGGARIPIVTTTLSEHLRVPVITAAQPELAAAIGGGLKAVRGTAPEGATSLAPAAAAAAALTPDPPEAPMSSTFQALAWSDADDVPEVAPPTEDYGDFGGDYDRGADAGDAARPRLAFEEPEPEAPVAAPVPWFRRSGVIAGVVLLGVFAAIAAAVLFVFRSDPSSEQTGVTTSATPTTTTSPPAPAPSTEPPAATPPPAAPPQETRTLTRQVPPPVVTATEAPPPAEPPPSSEPPPPPPSEEPPPPVESSTPPPWSPTAPYPTIPGLPWVPAPVPPPGP